MKLIAAALAVAMTSSVVSRPARGEMLDRTSLQTASAPQPDTTSAVRRDESVGERNVGEQRPAVRVILQSPYARK